MRLEVWGFPKDEWFMETPEAVTTRFDEMMKMPEYEGDPGFRYSIQEHLTGPYGWIPSASLCAGLLPTPEKAEGETIILAGVLTEHAYCVQIDAWPPLDAETRPKAIEFLKGVRAKSPVRDTKWTAEDVAKRLATSVPDEKQRKKFKPAVRTKHYIVFTNSGAGKLFAEKMEECYAKIRKVFPFEEVDTEVLMPVFLFKDKDEYTAYCTHTTKDASLGPSSKGHAWRDYYATYYDSPNDPVHIHEATHQIFMNRLHLDGGGSWFQEGVAEYMCTQPGDRKAFAKQAIRDSRFIPFVDFVQIDDLLSDSRLDANESYAQAASLIEFLRDGPWHPEAFQDFVHQMGSVGRENRVEIEKCFQKVYGTDIAGVEKAWKDYWRTR